jgi:hypothetical protein
MQCRVTDFRNSVHKLVNKNGKAVVQKHTVYSSHMKQYIMKELAKSLKRINNENSFCL